LVERLLIGRPGPPAISPSIDKLSPKSLPRTTEAAVSVSVSAKVGSTHRQTTATGSNRAAARWARP
jgi:hypothetical protein